MPKIYGEDYKRLKKGFIEVVETRNPFNEDDKTVYEVINKVDAVVCLVLTHDLKHMWVTKQYRPGTNSFEYELVAGLHDKDKNIEGILYDEIEEEIRIPRDKVAEIHYLGKGSPSAGMSTEVVYMYYAVLKEGAEQDDSLSKAADTDLIESMLMSFDFNTFNLIGSVVSQLIFKDVYNQLNIERR